MWGNVLVLRNKEYNLLLKREQEKREKVEVAVKTQRELQARQEQDRLAKQAKEQAATQEAEETARREAIEKAVMESNQVAQAKKQQFKLQQHNVLALQADLVPLDVAKPDTLESHEEAKKKNKKKKPRDGKCSRRTLKAQDRERQEKHDRGVLQNHMAKILDQDITLQVVEPPEKGPGKERNNRRKVKTVFPPTRRILLCEAELINFYESLPKNLRVPPRCSFCDVLFGDEEDEQAQDLTCLHSDFEIFLDLFWQAQRTLVEDGGFKDPILRQMRFSKVRAAVCCSHWNHTSFEDSNRLASSVASSGSSSSGRV